MTTATDSAHSPLYVARLSGIAVFLLGLAVLLGWLLNSAYVEQIVPGWIAMAPSSAVCFILAGAVLWRASLAGPERLRERLPVACRVGAVLVGFIALLRLIQEISGSPVDLDHFLLGAREKAGRMAFPTVLDFLLAAGAFLMIRSRRVRICQFFIILAGGIAWLGMSAYVFGEVPLIYFEPMAVHTALAFLVLNFGLLCLRPESGVMALFLHESNGGHLARRLVPVILFVPLVLAWLLLLGVRAGWFGFAGGAALFTYANILIFGGLVWRNAAMLDASDQQRREYEDRLALKAARLREQSRLLEHANVIGWNLTDGIFFWNKGAEEMYGWTEEEALGKSSHELLRTRFPRSFEDISSRFFAEGHWEGELTHRRRDGREIVVASSWRLHRSERGGVAAVVEVNNDITGLKNAENKLRAQVSRLHLLDEITRAVAERQDLQSIFQVVIRSLEDNLPVDFGCICLRDAGAAILRVACIGVKSGGLAMGLALGDQTRLPIDQNGFSRCLEGELVYEPETAELSYDLFRRMAQAGLHSVVLSPVLIENRAFGVLMVARRPGQGFSSGECEFLRQLSEHVALASQQAQLYGALQRAYDDLRQTQQVMAQQERLRAFGEMASGIAHDINNSLSPVMLYAGLLLEQEPNLKPSSRSQLETIRRAVEDISETIGRMKEFYRQREPQINLVPVEVNTLVPQVIELTRHRWNDMAQERGVVISAKTELGPNLPPMLGIESEIREALVNLIFNAVDAMPSGGTLTVRTRALEKNLCIEVTDTGTGMTEEARQRCLEPFYTTKGEKGTGLGLAMVYGMVQRHGAELEIESELGRGTTFRLVFPAAGHGAVAAPAGQQPGEERPARLRVLVVDDDPLLLRSLREFLEMEGHTVVTATGGQAGIDAYKAARGPEAFDLVITDLGMPYVDGRAVAQEVKTLTPFTPVILLTGWGKRMTHDGEAPANIDAVLSKPPKLYELREVLANYTS